METKIYRFYGIDTAVELLRPEAAHWQATNQGFIVWEDERPCPTWEEVMETMEKIKVFEDSINTIWSDKQIKEITGIFEEQ